MNLFVWVGVAVLSFLLGSIPFGFLLVRWFQGIDVRTVGSGNIGATNVARAGGKWIGIATLVLDCLKGWLPVFLVMHLPIMAEAAPEKLYTLTSLAALMAIAGHMFTPWLGFRGGKGVATGFGAFLALAPVVALASVAVFLATVVATRYVSLGSILAAGIFPVLLWLLERQHFPAPALAICTAAALLVILRHRQNIGRLLTGTESRFGARKA